jgi:hypothetical protein
MRCTFATLRISDDRVFLPPSSPGFEVDMTRQPYTLGTFVETRGNDTVFSFNTSDYPFPAQPTPK